MSTLLPFDPHYRNTSAHVHLQAGVVALGLRFCRIDGSLSKPEDRQEQVRLFQTTPNIAVFLLTSQVGFVVGRAFSVASL